MTRCFNSRSRVGSDLHVSSTTASPLAFQFALPRGERPYYQSWQYPWLNVSIRAPAWGATRILPMSCAMVQFQFALPRGERRVPLQQAAMVEEFQFALPRGERPPQPSPRIWEVQFQFALPRGERLITLFQFLIVFRFNSRSRVGSDGSEGRAAPAPWCFNSRSRVGSDADSRPLGYGVAVSIRAPAWGATSRLRGINEWMPFQFALPRGERPPPAVSQQNSMPVSIRAPAWGATLLKTTSSIRISRFNSRSRVGSDKGGVNKPR